MALKSKVSKLLILCLTLALLSSMLLVGTSLNVSAESAHGTWFTPLVDGDSTSKYFSANRGSTTTKATSPSGFGNGATLTWDSATAASNLASNPSYNTGWNAAVQVTATFGTTTSAVSMADQEALVFWMENSDDWDFNANFWLQEYVTSLSASKNWTITNKSTYYTVDTNGELTPVTASTGYVKLSKGFTGWVVVPIASLYLNSPGENLPTVPTAYNLILQRDALSDTVSATDNDLIYSFDEFGMVSDLDAALTYFQSLYTKTDEGDEDEETYPDAVVTDPCDGFTTLADFDTILPTSYDATQGGTEEIAESPSFYGKGVTFTLPEAELSNLLQLRAAFSATSTAGTEGLAFWISVPKAATETTYKYTLWAVNADGGNFTVSSNYYTVDMTGVASLDTTATVTYGRGIQLQSGFSGWVIVPASSLSHSTATWGDCKINELILVSESANGNGGSKNYYIDEIGMITDLETTINQLSSYYKVLYNWDGVATGSVSGASANATVTTEEVSPSGYGSGIKWTMISGQSSSWLYHSNVNTVIQNDDAMAFWIAAKNVESDTTTQPRITLYIDASLNDSSSTVAWSPREGKAFYTITDDGTVSNSTLKHQGFALPVGFSGWVVIPFSSMSLKSSYTTDVTFGTAKTTIKSYNFSFTSTTIAEIHLDELFFTSNGAGGAESLVLKNKLEAKADELNADTASHEVIDLMRTARKSIAGAADSAARKAAYDAAAADLATVCNPTKNNTTNVQQRTTDYTLRFISEIDDDYLLYLKKTYGSAKVEFGTLIARSDLYAKAAGDLEYTDLTAGFSRSRATTIKRISTFVPTEGQITVENGVEGTTLYTCVIRSIPEQSRNIDIRARSYVRYTDAYGVSHTVYGDETQCSYDGVLDLLTTV